MKEPALFKIRPKQATVRAIQWTGKNDKNVARFARSLRRCWRDYNKKGRFIPND